MEVSSSFGALWVWWASRAGGSTRRVSRWLIRDLGEDSGGLLTFGCRARYAEYAVAVAVLEAGLEK